LYCGGWGFSVLLFFIAIACLLTAGMVKYWL